jgi:SAM-dependent methyltransferase
VRGRVSTHFDALARSGAWVDLYDGPETAANVSFRVRLARAVELLPADALHVLDVGCGPAPFAGPLAARGAGYVGIDLVASMLGQARAREPRARLVQGGLPLPFRDGVFDAVVALGFLEYSDNVGTALRELARVVRPRGTVVVSIPKAFHVDTITVALAAPARRLAALLWGRRSDTLPRTLLQPGQLDSIARSVGLRPKGGLHYHYTPLPYPLTVLIPGLTLRATRAAESSPWWRRLTVLAQGYLARYARD